MMYHDITCKKKKNKKYEKKRGEKKNLLFMSNFI